MLNQRNWLKAMRSTKTEPLPKYWWVISTVIYNRIQKKTLKSGVNPSWIKTWSRMTTERLILVSNGGLQCNTKCARWRHWIDRVRMQSCATRGAVKKQRQLALAIINWSTLIDTMYRTNNCMYKYILVLSFRNEIRY